MILQFFIFATVELPFSFWEKYDEEHTVVRFATSWSTTQEELDELRRIMTR